MAGASGPISYASAPANECAVGAATAECAAQTSEHARLAAGEASSTALVTGNSFSGMSGYTVANLAAGTLSAERSHHGGGTVFGGVAAEPWYADPTLTVPAAFGAAVGGGLGLGERSNGMCGIDIVGNGQALATPCAAAPRHRGPPRPWT